MNGVHDLGGLQDMGPIEYEHNEPVFHHDWEARVYVMTRAMRAWRRWSLDAQRYAIELLPPADYFRMSYYERWFAGLVDQLVRNGFVTRAEVESGAAAPGTLKATPAFTLDMLPRIADRGIRSANEPATRPRFSEGQQVRALNINPPGHTRLPRYARAKAGTIVRDHGVYNFPDTTAHGLGEKRQHVYSVRFAARELWGASAGARDFVHLDLFEDYLERA